MTYDHANNACLQSDGLFIDVIEAEQSQKKHSFGTLQNSIQALLLVANASVQPANRVAHSDPAPSKLEDMDL